MCMWQHNVDGKLPETAADWFVYMYIKKKTYYSQLLDHTSRRIGLQRTVY